MKVGYSRFDSYSKPIQSLEIVGEPMADKFKADYPPKVVKKSDYTLGDISPKKTEPITEPEETTITIPKHTERDKELVDVFLGGEKHRIPRWMVKYVSGPC